MSILYDKSTYREIIDDVQAEVGTPDRFSSISPSTFVTWINQAQEWITKEIPIKEEYELRLYHTKTDYEYRDRPFITAASNAVPTDLTPEGIVVTVPGHGFDVADEIMVSIIGVQGNLNANGRYTAYVVDADNIRLAYVVGVSGVSVSVGNVTVTTKRPHGLIRYCNSAVYSLTSPIAIIDPNGSGSWYTAFSVTDEYTVVFSGGVDPSYDEAEGWSIYFPVPGSGAYTAGGRLWRADEIPTFYDKVYPVGMKRVDEKNYPVDVIETSAVHDYGNRYGNSNHGGEESTPIFVSYNQSGGNRFLRISNPVSVAAPGFYTDPWVDITFQFKLRIVARQINASDEAVQVYLHTKYDYLISSFVKHKMYESIGDLKTSSFYFNEFINQTGGESTRSSITPRMKVTFK